MDSSNKVLFIIGGIVTALLILTFGFFIVNFAIDKGNSLVNEVSEGVDTMMESEFTMYDGKEISGSAVANVISDIFSSNDNVYVLVKTNADTSGVYYVCGSDGSRLDTDVERSLVRNSRTKTHDSYITPTGVFYGEVVRNENGAIVGLTFTQQ